jgi:nitrite reductase/ring-hydroxylating ferredoxin subunit
MILKYFKLKIINFCVILFFIFNSQSCSKDFAPYVPDVPVYYELSLNNELYFLGETEFVTITSHPTNKNYSIVDYHKKTPLTFTIDFKTYGNGVIIYHKSADEYQAFDLTCPYKGLEDHCSLKLQAGDFVATCPCCNSAFVLSANGAPSTKSIATRPLMMYSCTLTNNGMQLIVSK